MAQGKTGKPKMTDAQKLEALAGMVKVPVISKAVPEFGDTFPVDDSKMVATYLLINHRVTQLLFNHDFAKALFGEGSVFIADEDIAKESIGRVTLSPLVEYQYRLQQIVILPTPSEQIDYMYKAVFGDE